MSKHQERELYVGYLPMPKALTPFYRIVIVALIVVGLVAAFFLSNAQKSAGTGTWDAFETVTLEGTLRFEPYPVLHTATTTVLLVQLGKLSANELAAPFADTQISVTGFPIKRGDWHMLEVASTDDFKPLAKSDAQAQPHKSLGEITVQGEIVDSKCYFGVMKPGNGKVHRACARLCLQGGIPPVLVAKGSAETLQGYVLTRADGSSAAVELASLAAVPVEISGELQQRGNLLYLRMNEPEPRLLSELEQKTYGKTLATLAIENHQQCIN